VTVAILGGGMLSCCAAMELAGRGERVVLVEAAPELLRGAAHANEGKLHLGHVYPRDRSLATARLMLRGALHAHPALRRWLGRRDFTRSAPYRYAVHRDSLSSPAEVAHHYAACAALARELLAGAPPDCFGADPRQPARRVPLSADCDPRHVQALFETPEISLDNREVGAALRQAVAAEPRIEVLYNTQAAGARLQPDAVEVTLRDPAGREAAHRFDHVVNATWTSRLALDAMVGLAPPAEWLFRLKYLVRVRGARPMGVLPTTVCVGAFGDVVVLGDGHLVLSWYPAGRQAVSAAQRPPDWPTRLEGMAAEEMRGRMVEGLGALFPPLLALLDDPALAHSEVSGGVIFAVGGGDVDDPASLLHGRHVIGRRSLGRWHSVDPGKWTMCPLYATEVAAHIRPLARRAA
jgi:glycine/D-amino acid oxidase-like deaminating enzyme